MTEKNFIQRNGQKIAAILFFGVGLVALYQWYAASNGLSPLQVVQQLLDFKKNGMWGVVIYVVLYAVRPLILFPSTVLTLAGGFVFGPILGVLYTSSIFCWMVTRLSYIVHSSQNNSYTSLPASVQSGKSARMSKHNAAASACAAYH